MAKLEHGILATLITNEMAEIPGFPPPPDKDAARQKMMTSFSEPLANAIVDYFNQLAFKQAWFEDAGINVSPTGLSQTSDTPNLMFEPNHFSVMADLIWKYFKQLSSEWTPEGEDLLMAQFAEPMAKAIVAWINNLAISSSWAANSGWVWESTSNPPKFGSPTSDEGPTNMFVNTALPDPLEDDDDDVVVIDMKHAVEALSVGLPSPEDMG